MISFSYSSYFQSRLEYFERMYERKKKSLKWWECQKPGKQYDKYTIYINCCDIGAEMAYINDVIKMLKGGNTDENQAGQRSI